MSLKKIKYTIESTKDFLIKIILKGLHHFQKLNAIWNLLIIYLIFLIKANISENKKVKLLNTILRYNYIVIIDFCNPKDYDININNKIKIL